MDKRFKTEVAYFKHMADIGAVERLKSEVKAGLPSQAGMTASESAMRLAAVAGGKLFEWYGLGGQSLALSVLEVVRCLAQDKAPMFGDANDRSALADRTKSATSIVLVAVAPARASAAKRPAPRKDSGKQVVSNLFKKSVA